MVERRTTQPTVAQSASYDDPDIAELARRIRELESKRNPFGYGVSVAVEFSAPGTQVVKHRLGRSPVGWLVTTLANNTAPPVAPVIVERSRSNTELELYCSTAGTRATIQVF